MHIYCSICRDLFVPQSEVFVTKCGHLYHQSCISMWFEKSSACPKCRTTSHQKPYRVYFDVDNDTKLDTHSLQNRVDNLMENLQVKCTENNKLKKKIEDMELKIAALQLKVTDSKGQIEHFKWELKCLKQKMNSLINENKVVESLRHDNESMKTKLQRMTELEALIKGTESEVHEMLKTTPVTALAVHQLCLFVEALKQHMKKSEEKYETENNKLTVKYNHLLNQVKKQRGKKIDKAIQTKDTTELCIKEEIPCQALLKTLSNNIFPSIISPKATECCSRKSLKPKERITEKPSLKLRATVINNLDKTAKKDICNDLSDIEIDKFIRPAKNKMLKSSFPNESIFKKQRVSENLDLKNSNSDCDIIFHVWGGSKRNPLAVPTNSEEFAALQKQPCKKMKRDTSRKCLAAVKTTKKLDSYLL